MKPINFFVHNESACNAELAVAIRSAETSHSIHKKSVEPKSSDEHSFETESSEEFINGVKKFVARNGKYWNFCQCCQCFSPTQKA
jgi:hypothetical protein